MPVLKTRLFKPVVKEGYLTRKHLLEKMTVNHYKPVHTIVAPAGYGKSVLVSQWLDYTGQSYSWASLGEDCNDLKIFLRLLCNSFLPYLSEKDDICDILIEAPELPDLDHIATHIVNSLAGIQDEHILVLDDYHLIENPDVHKLMQILAENIKQKHIIVFISRFDPPLKWSKLRYYDLVNELSTIDLQFSRDEIRDLSSLFFSNPLDREISSVIFKSTEGWIVPTRLILKNIAEKKLNPQTLKDKAVDKLEQTYGFLEDTFNEADEDIQESLMIASLFQRFSISLLSQIFVHEYPEKKLESELLINRLEKYISQSLFIISLDSSRNWYRFHDLIRDFLNNRIYSGFSKDKINRALITGSKFFENVQSFEEAIQLGVKGGNIPLAIAIIEKNRMKFLNQQQLDVLDHWLKFIPAGVTENYPVLLLTRASVSEKKGDFEKMMQDLERAKALMAQLDEKDEHSRVQWGEYYSIKSSTDYLMGDINLALTNSEKAMQLLNHENTFLYYFTMIYRVFALNSLGKSAEAFDLLNKDKNKRKLKHEKIPAENYLIHTMLLMLNGKLNHYNYEAKLARDIAKEESRKTVLVLASYYLALSSYMRNELKEALLYINKTLVIKYSARPFWMIICFQLKAACLLALKKIKDYNSCVIEMTEYVNQFNIPFYNNLLEIIKMEFSLSEVEHYKPREQFKALNFRSSDIVHVYFKPFLTEIKLLLATNKEQYLEQAETLLKQYREKARSTSNRILLIQVICLNIVLLIKQNQTEKALELLRELLTETKEDGLIRLYTDWGMEMKRLFDKLSEEEKQEDYVHSILDSFTTEHGSDRLPQRASNEKIDITIKEVKLLMLLKDGLQNKEIAEIIYIAPSSVEKSLYRLYKKLNVNNRTEAIYKAIELGLYKVGSLSL